MRVNIGPYKNWFGPYQLADLLCFWVKKTPDEYGVYDKPQWVHKFGEFLAHGNIEPEPAIGDITLLNEDRHNTILYKFLQWVQDKRERKISVRIDRWDTWSMDCTLAYIALPMLKQLKSTKHGSPMVDDEDVPVELRSTSAEPKEDPYDTDSNHHLRWDWVLDEMMFAFSSKVDDSWEEQFASGEASFAFKRREDGLSELTNAGTYKYDFEGRKEYQKRITNGFRLFGKYYENLWD